MVVGTSYESTFENMYGERWRVWQEGDRLLFSGSDIDWQPHDLTKVKVNLKDIAGHTFALDGVVLEFEEWVFLAACQSAWHTRQRAAAAP